MPKLKGGKFKKVSIVIMLTVSFLLMLSGLALADLASGPAYYQGAVNFTSLDFSIIPADLIVAVDGGAPVTIHLDQNYPDAASLENAINSQITGASVSISSSGYTEDPYGNRTYDYITTFQTDTSGSNRSIYVAGSAAPLLGLDTITPADGVNGATWKGSGMVQNFNYSGSFTWSFKVTVDGGSEQSVVLNSNYGDLMTLSSAISSQLTGATAYYAGGGAIAIKSNNTDPATSSIIVHVPFSGLGFSAYYPGEDVAEPTPEPVEPTPTPAPAPAPAPTSPPPPAPVFTGNLIQNGANGAAVSNVQEKLKDLGFDSGAIDGKFGPKTLDAIKKAQAALGLVPDGIVGPLTWGRLFGFNVGAYTAPVNYGSNNVTVVGAVQDKLIKLGLNPGKIDGKFGPKSLAAIKAFQKSKGLVPDGIIGPLTWKALFG